MQSISGQSIQLEFIILMTKQDKESQIEMETERILDEGQGMEDCFDLRYREARQKAIRKLNKKSKKT